MERVTLWVYFGNQWYIHGSFTDPTADNIVKMSEVYGCTTDKLLKGE